MVNMDLKGLSRSALSLHAGAAGSLEHPRPMTGSQGTIRRAGTPSAGPFASLREGQGVTTRCFNLALRALGKHGAHAHAPAHESWRCSA